MPGSIIIFLVFFFLIFHFTNWEKEKGKTDMMITKRYVIWMWASCGQYTHSRLNPLSLMLKYFSCTIFITRCFRSATLAAEKKSVVWEVSRAIGEKKSAFARDVTNTGNGKRESGIGDRGTGNGKLGTRNGEWEWRTGNRERETGN